MSPFVWIEKKADQVSWVIWEWMKTLSSEKSFFSSKRLERLIIFLTATYQINKYVHRNLDKLTATDMVMIYSAQMVYAGFMVKEIRKDLTDIKDEKTNSNNPTGSGIPGDNTGV